MMNTVAQSTGQPYKVFDWDKAVDLLIEHKAQTAWAGLQHDLEWTAGTIFKDGKPLLEPGDLDGPPYLASIWAIPASPFGASPSKATGRGKVPKHLTTVRP